ncbi:MAG: nickel-dependent lactate racemase [Candidatus Hydrogenedentes bacterium]|nr:nickel-dependent lactate racemase [Candidatus Hydrogenedentota bacterium]
MNRPYPSPEALLEKQSSWLRLLDRLTPNPLAALDDPAAALRDALRRPLGMDHPALQSFRRGERVALVVPDASRKAQLSVLLPELLDQLADCGIREEDISFFFALGVHRPTTREEQRLILGAEVYGRFHERCINHDARDDKALVFLGETRRGTAVYLNRSVMEREHVILLGSVVPHYFAGFGGGRKALVPGLAGAQTIAHNHALNLHPTEARLDPRVRIAALDGNPVAEDLLEAARMAPPDFIINTVLTGSGALGGLFVGELDEAHRAACRLSAETFCVPIEARADLVIASAGDAPDFVQSHKSLVNAFAAVKPEGRVILLAPAPEGLGGRGYQEFLQMGHPDKVIEALRREADINGQTALSTLEKAPRALLVTQLCEEDVRKLGMTRCDDLEHALRCGREHFRKEGVSHPTGYWMPRAGTTVPLPSTASAL